MPTSHARTDAPAPGAIFDLDSAAYFQTGDAPIYTAAGHVMHDADPDYLEAVSLMQAARAHAIVTGSRGCLYNTAQWQRPGRHTDRAVFADYGERGSATEHVVVAVMLTLSALVFVLVLLAWWAPRADATRVVPGSGWQRIDYCDNRAGVQTILDVTTGHRFRVTHVTPDGRRVCRKVAR